MVTATFSDSIRKKIFLKLTGINSKRCEEIFWFLFENGETNFSEIKKELGMNQKIVSENLKKLMEKDIIIKTKNNKYALSPRFSKIINPLLTFDYIATKQPYKVFINPFDKYSNIHLLYGFKNPSYPLKLIIDEINNGIDSLRELKHFDENNKKYISKDACIYSIMHLWNKAFLNDGGVKFEEFLILMKKLAREAIRIGGEMDLDISHNMKKFLREVRVINKILSNYSIVDGFKSNNVALLSVPLFQEFHPCINIEAMIDYAKRISIEDYKEYDLFFEEIFIERYGNLIKLFQLNPFLNKIWKGALILHIVVKSITKNHLNLVEYEFYNSLKDDFSKKEIDLLWKVIKDFKEDYTFFGPSYIVPVWISIICYKGIEEIWKNEKDRIFHDYYRKLKRFGKFEIYEEMKKLDKKDKALLVTEYIIGERFFREREEEKKQEVPYLP